MAPIVSQMRGPDIQVSLFGDAARAGTSVGNAIPSQFTAGVQGAIEGVKTGQQLIANDQNITLRQNEIDNLDVTNQLRRDQLENQQNVNKINKLKLEAQSTNQNLSIENERKKLETQNGQLDYAKQLSDLNNSFQKEMQSADPQQQAEIVLGTKYQGLFGANPKLYQQQLEAIRINPNNGLDENTRSRIGYAVRKGQASEYWEKEAAKNQEDFLKSKAAMMNESWVSEAATKLKSTPEDVASNLLMVPHGMYQVSGDRLKPDIRAGGWAKTPNYIASSDLYKGRYDLVDPSTGTLVDGTGSLTDANKKQQSKYKGDLSTQNGTYRGREISKIDDEQKAASAPPANQQIEDLAPQAAHLEGKSPFAASVSKSLNLTPTQFAKVEPVINSLANEVAGYIEVPTNRGSIQSIKTYNETVNNIVRGVTDDQFENSETLKTQYTESDVTKYNESLRRSLYSSRAKSYGLYSMGSPFSSVMFGETAPDEQVINAFKVATPQDLYYLRQRDVLTSKVNGAVQGAYQKALARKNSGANTQRASQNALSYLDGVRKQP